MYLNSYGYSFLNEVSRQEKRAGYITLGDGGLEVEKKTLSKKIRKDCQK